MDEDPGEPYVMGFHLDNNRLPEISIGNFPEEVLEIFRWLYSSDPEDDDLEFIYEYTINGGQDWSVATVVDIERQSKSSGDRNMLSTMNSVNSETPSIEKGPSSSRPKPDWQAG